MKGKRLFPQQHPSRGIVSYTFRSLSVNKRETVTQMVDPLNFRFMDARLKNVASLRRRRDAPPSSTPLPLLFPPFPVSRRVFPSSPVFLPSVSFFFFDMGSSFSDIDASDSIPYWLYREVMSKIYNKPPPLLALRCIRSQPSFVNTVEFAAFRDKKRPLL